MYDLSFKDCSTLKEKTDKLFDVLSESDIDGCITGSCMLDDYSPDDWCGTPDVDVFVYSEAELVRVTALAVHAMGMGYGTGSEQSAMQEQAKLKMLRTSGANRRYGVTSYKFNKDGVVLNVSYKTVRIDGKVVPLFNAHSVLLSFDMSIIMQGYDIPSHSIIDLRVGSPKVAVPNPFRDHDCMSWDVAKWVRQFDRVVKYYKRGYDTRPMARFYLEMIDGCLAMGRVFDSEKSKESYEALSIEFIEKRKMIAEWLSEHEED